MWHYNCDDVIATFSHHLFSTHVCLGNSIPSMSYTERSHNPGMIAWKLIHRSIGHGHEDERPETVVMWQQPTEPLLFCTATSKTVGVRDTGKLWASYLLLPNCLVLLHSSGLLVVAQDGEGSVDRCCSFWSVAMATLAHRTTEQLSCWYSGTYTDGSQNLPVLSPG